MYPFGSHTLTVTYNGDSSKTPLVLAYLVIQNDTTVANSTVGSAHSASSHIHVPAIAGGVIGGVLCLLLVVLLVLYQRRRQQSSLAEKEARIIVDEPNELGHQGIQNTFNYSRLPAKSFEGYTGSPLISLSPGHRPSPSGSSSANVPDTSSYPLESPSNTEGQNSRNHSDHNSPKPPADLAGLVSGSSSFVVHRDSGARLPQEPRIDIPPAYTPD